MSKHPVRLLAAVLVSAWIVILLMPGDSHAQLYRYTDKNGRVVITDNPPPGVRSEVLENQDLAPSERIPEAQGAAPMPVPGSRDQASPPMPQPGRRDQVAPPEKPGDAEMRRVADEEIQKQKEEVQRKLRERQQEKQRRLEEADRLEQEAKKPVQPTQENIDRQRKLMEEAQRLREMP
jgi:hypothetical protein